MKTFIVADNWNFERKLLSCKFLVLCSISRRFRCLSGWGSNVAVNLSIIYHQIQFPSAIWSLAHKSIFKLTQKLYSCNGMLHAWIGLIKTKINKALQVKDCIGTDSRTPESKLRSDHLSFSWVSHYISFDYILELDSPVKSSLQRDDIQTKKKF